jgi:hypothetical protein
MTTQVAIAARDLIALDQNCTLAQRWIVPGALSLDFMLIQLSIAMPARAIAKQVEALQDHHAIWDGEAEARVKREKPILNPVSKEQIGTEIIMKDPVAFAKAYQDLMDRDFTIDIPHYLTPEHFRRMTAEMVDDTKGLIPPYGPAFGPVMEGFARPAIAPADGASNGAVRSLAALPGARTKKA